MSIHPFHFLSFVRALQSRWMLLAWMVMGTVLPGLLIQSMPLDVVESITWGHEWQWGYYKHPPLPAWLVYLSFRALGHFGPFVLSTLCVLAALGYVYGLGLRLISRERAAAGAMLLLGVFYYTPPNTLEFNHNIAQIPLWAAIGYYFYTAVHDGRWRDWLLLGCCAGLGMLTKYSVVILLACLGMYLLATHWRFWLWRPHPWASIALALLIFAPHLHWLVQHDWLPMAYASSRAGAAAATATSARWRALSFLGTQIFNHLPMLLIVLASGTLRCPRLQKPRSSDTSLLLLLVAGPVALTTLLGLLFGMGLRDMWGTPMWNFSGLLVMSMLPDDDLSRRLSRLALGTSLWLAAITLGMSLYLAAGAQWRSSPSRIHWPAQAIAAQTQQSWAETSSCPLEIVAGSYWLAGLVAVESANMPSVLIDEDPRYAPWITPERLQQSGAIWIWTSDEAQSSANPQPPALLEALPESGWQLQQGKFSIPWAGNSKWQPLTLAWRTYVPAHCKRN